MFSLIKFFAGKFENKFNWKLLHWKKSTTVFLTKPSSTSFLQVLIIGTESWWIRESNLKLLASNEQKKNRTKCITPFSLNIHAYTNYCYKWVKIKNQKINNDPQIEIFLEIWRFSWKVVKPLLTVVGSLSFQKEFLSSST